MNRKTLVDDAQRMEDAAIDLISNERYQLRTVLYWTCVAVLHILQWILKQETRK